MVISFGIIHGIGGASVALNLATIAYIGDISTPETKVKILFWFTFQFDFFLYLLDFKKISHHVWTERKDLFNEPTFLTSKIKIYHKNDTNKKCYFAKYSGIHEAIYHPTCTNC